MAVIGKIRKHSGLVVIIVGIAIAAFVIGDFGTKRSRIPTNIGVVGGDEITLIDFNNQVDENIRNQEENAGQKVNASQAFNIRQATWDKMVKDLILGKQMEKIGLTVTDEEMLELVQGKNPHRFILQYFKDPNTGAYDPNLVRNYLRNLDKMDQKAKDQWFSFEKAIKEDRQETKYRNLLMKGYFVPKAMAKREYVLRGKNYQFRAINPGYADIPDSTIQVTDQDIQATYEENKHLFLGEEDIRDVDFVIFEVEPSAEDRQKISAYVEKIYQELQETSDVPNFVNAVSDDKIDTTYKRKGSFTPYLDSILFSSSKGAFIAPFEADKQWTMAKVLDFQSRPDSIKASMILITYREAGILENVTRNKEQAEQLADSLLLVLKAQPDKFGEMARTFSNYPDADKNGGDLGWMIDGDVNFDPYFTSGLTAKPGELKIKETRLGYHILKFEEKTAPNQKIQVAMITRKVEPSNETHQAYYMKANEFAGKNTTIEAFDKGAVEAGIQKRAAQAVRKMDVSLVGINNSREVVRWSFSEKNEVGTVSPVFEVEGNYIIAIIKKIKPKGIPSLELIREQIEPMARTKKKLEMVLDRTKKAMDGNKDLVSLASALNCKVDTLNSTFLGWTQGPLSSEQALMGKVFAMQKGAVSQPLLGKYNVFVVAMDEITEPAEKEDLSMEKMQIGNAFTSKIYNALNKALEKSTNLEDNRVLFY